MPKFQNDTLNQPMIEQMFDNMLQLVSNSNYVISKNDKTYENDFRSNIREAQRYVISNLSSSNNYNKETKDILNDIVDQRLKMLKTDEPRLKHYGLFGGRKTRRKKNKKRKSRKSRKSRK